MNKVIALDVEGILISNAMSQFPRPCLYEFLESCKAITERVVVFTTVREPLFRQIANLLVSEGNAPEWFSSVEYISWSGAQKDLTLIDGADLGDIVLVDDYRGYIKEDQLGRWVEIVQFEYPNSDSDGELEVALKNIRYLLG